MPSVTTKSGQATRSRLISMFREAQQLALAGRESARAARSLITRAVAESTVREDGDRVHIEMPRETWDALRKGAQAP